MQGLWIYEIWNFHSVFVSILEIAFTYLPILVSPGFSVTGQHFWLLVVWKHSTVRCEPYQQCCCARLEMLFWKALFREISNEGSSESSFTKNQYFPSVDYSSGQSAKQFLPVNEDEPQNFGSLETAYENNITTEFLNSVRNMNAEEVTATLHKIAASNPAFRGNLHAHVYTYTYIDIYITSLISSVKY